VEKKIIDSLNKIENELEVKKQKLESVDINKNYQLYVDLAKTIKILETPLKLFDEYKKCLKIIEDSNKIDDFELLELAKQEKANAKKRIDFLEKEIVISLLPKSEYDNRNVIVEIKGAVGGDEANMFANDLERMYKYFAESKGWKIQSISSRRDENDRGNSIIFKIIGDDVYAKMKFESGVHRVQRIPTTDSQGRIHTSTATVSVLPEPEKYDIKINSSDLRIDTFRSSGAGGQHVNTTDSAVRITHNPTGIVTQSQDGRSQHNNKEIALERMEVLLLENKIREEEIKAKNMKSLAVGSGDRSEKIRTYNYPQNRVTDHRINLTLQKLDQIIEGKLDEIIDALIVYEQEQKLSEI